MFHESKLPHDVCNFRSEPQFGCVSSRGAARGACRMSEGSTSRRTDRNTFTFRSWRINRSKGAATGQQMLNDLQQWHRLPVCVCVCVGDQSWCVALIVV